MELKPRPGMRGNVPAYLEEFEKVILSITGNEFWYDNTLYTLKQLGLMSDSHTISKVNMILAINELYFANNKIF